MSDQENFKDKYTKVNYITQKLINNFYNKIFYITRGIDFDSVLELGCGHGFSTTFLKKIFKDKKVEASEYLPELVAEAKIKNPDIKIITESIYKTQRQDNELDMVVALEVLEHLEDPSLAMKELHRITKKYCLISVPREPLWRFLNMARGSYLTSFGNTPGHVNHWSKNGFKNFASQYFEVERVFSALPWTILLCKKVEGTEDDKSKNEGIKQFLKYGLVSAFTYAFNLGGTYFLVEYFNLTPNIAYFLIISIIYVFVYIINTTYVFTVDFSKKRLLKYVVTLVFFWFLNNLFFNLLYNIFNIQYLSIILFNILILGMIRFVVHKKLVFNKR